ncbi:MAG: hypothetical protein RLZ05_212 [Bacteroidota bacterium]|jgi:hypothetical protein
MFNKLFRQSLPHLGVIAIFLLAAALFCRPALEGDQLNQHDNVSWKGMAQSAFEYKVAKGQFPLWNANLFGGMPNYQIAMEGKSILPNLINVFSLGLPKPMNFFFLACIFFYILALTMGSTPLVGALVAIGYSYSTYNPVIIAAGHDTQMIATACMPLLLAGLLLVYNRTYWLGLSLTTLGAYLLIAANHLQITYYFLLIAVIITIAYTIYWIQTRQWKHLGIAAAITIFSAVLSIGGNALILWTSAEYSRYTMRGGKDVVITDGKVNTTKTSGLDTSYAFEYSLGNRESLTLLLPNAFGGGHSRNFEEGSAIAKKLTAAGIDEANAEQLAQGLPQYWGSLPYTAGPAYLGVLIFILGLLGFIINKGPLRYGLMVATLLGVFISWGKNLSGFNLLLFEYLPLFNKFRAPSMAQAIPQLTLSISTLVLLKDIFKGEIEVWTKKNLYYIAGLFTFLFVLWLAQDYSAPIDQQVLAAYTDKSGSDQFARSIVAGMIEERQHMFGLSILRALVITGLLATIIGLFVSKRIKMNWAIGLLIIVASGELLITSHAYLDEKSYQPAEEYTQSNFSATPQDVEILADKDPNYRVLNLATSTFNDSRTSYFHKSIGGYHAAKLRIYQDLIEKYFAGSLNQGILNMLNTRYVIVSDPTTGQQSVVKNDQALGNCWLVTSIVSASNRAAALEQIGQINLKDSVVIEAASYQGPTQFNKDSSSFIRMTSFDNDTLTYEANCTQEQFAVFSEIYYPKGWNAYVDGQKTEYLNVNYVLRGLPIQKGKHEIRFVFEPTSYKNGTKIMYASSFLIALVILGGIGMFLKKKAE